METQQTPPERMGSLTESEGGPLQRAEWESDMAGPQAWRHCCATLGDWLGKHPQGSPRRLLPELWASGPDCGV